MPNIGGKGEERSRLQGQARAGGVKEKYIKARKNSFIVKRPKPPRPK